MSSPETPDSSSPIDAFKWKKGQSGNPNGRPKNASIVREIENLLADGVKGQNIQKALARVAVQKALAGDIRFYQMVMDWTDGKVPDKIETDNKVEVVVKYEVPNADSDPDSAATA